MTVTPDLPHKKFNLEKLHNVNAMKDNLGQLQMNLSPLSPTWMHAQSKLSGSQPHVSIQTKKSLMFHKSFEPQVLRGGENRRFLMDRAQPEKSAFAFGDIRHNEFGDPRSDPREMSQTFFKPKRLVEWDNSTKGKLTLLNSSRQREVTAKIV